MALTAKAEAKAQGDDFIFVENKSLDEINEQLVDLRYDVEDLYYRSEKQAKFLKKFLELFVAFSVFVIPIALAFIFIHLTDKKTWNFCGTAYVSFNETEEVENKTEYVTLTLANPKSMSSAFRQAIVFTLISLSFFVGIPYYYFSLDQLHRLQHWDVDSDSEYEEDEPVVDPNSREPLPATNSNSLEPIPVNPNPGEAMPAKEPEEPVPVKADVSGEKEVKMKKRTKNQKEKKESKLEKDLMEMLAEISVLDHFEEAAKAWSKKQLENFD